MIAYPVALVRRSANSSGAVRKSRGNLQPDNIDFIVDIVYAVLAIGGFTS